MFFQRQQTQQRILELGPTALVDLNQISGVYTEGQLLVIRIGGMGVIKLSYNDLFDRSVPNAYATIRAGLGLK